MARFKGYIIGESAAALQVEQDSNTKAVASSGRAATSLAKTAWVPKSLMDYCRKGPKPTKEGDRQEVEFTVPDWKAKQLPFREVMD